MEPITILRTVNRTTLTAQVGTVTPIPIGDINLRKTNLYTIHYTRSLCMRLPHQSRMANPD